MDLVECRRADVTVRQTEIWVVQNVEELRAELELLRFGQANVLQHPETPICIARPFADVPPRRSELLHWRVGIRSDSLKCAGVQPGIHRMRPRVWILSSQQIWPVGGKSSDLRRSALLRNV